MTTSEQQLIDRLSPELAARVRAELDTKSIDNDYTHIHLLLDRTGSMDKVKQETIGGVNAFIAEQQRQSGKCTFSLVQFDSNDPYEVIHDFTPIAHVAPLTEATFVPRSWTPLYDAMDKSVDECLKRIQAMDTRPGKVIIVVVTDGEDNASTKANKTTVKDKIKTVTEKGWVMVYLGVGIDAMADGADLGIAKGTTMNVGGSGAAVTCCFAATARNVTAYRSCGDMQSMVYSEADRTVQHQQGAVGGTATAP